MDINCSSWSDFMHYTAAKCLADWIITCINAVRESLFAKSAIKSVIHYGNTEKSVCSLINYAIWDISFTVVRHFNSKLYTISDIPVNIF